MKIHALRILAADFPLGPSGYAMYVNVVRTAIAVQASGTNLKAKAEQHQLRGCLAGVRRTVATNLPANR